MKRLDGKIAIITGASQGMGEAHARMFVAEGAKVMMTDVNEGRGKEIAEELGGNAAFRKHDVAEKSQWEAVVAATEDKFGTADILVNNAGIIGKVHEEFDFPEEDFLEVFKVNELGVWLGMCAVIPGMRKKGGGSIVNISSIAGMTGFEQSSNTAYVASKYAVRGMTKYGARLLGKDNIRVNSVHPGFILTPMMVAATDEHGGGAVDNIPLKRMAQPSEVSSLVLFLASDESAFISGNEHVIDGAMIAG